MSWSPAVQAEHHVIHDGRDRQHLKDGVDGGPDGVARGAAPQAL